MSEDLVLPPPNEGKDIINNAGKDENMSESAVVPKTVREEVDDDLEDGEIDDDDDNDEPIAAVDSKIVGAASSAPIGLAANTANKPLQSPSAPNNMVSVKDILNEKKLKPKKHHVEDDFAGSIESAIAAALKKDGIMPPMPKILETREDGEKMEKQSEKDALMSKSSRRRKRRKLRDEREKEREKKKHRTSSPDTTALAALAAAAAAAKAASAAADEDLDDDEMLCVRGGSPPPAGHLPPFTPHEPTMPPKKEGYDSDESYSSYEDSYDSGHNYQRYSSSRKKDVNTGSSVSRSKRKERSSNRRDDERRSEKRSRRNFDDSGGEDKYQDRHPQQPRKLELCKFYLMECCAKKDKCSYMHSDFPCKYYYLGMECVYRSACKFSHGKPLTDQLRSVLLKHLETAPKEILGTFRRISRENALNLMNATHEKICEEHGVENTLASTMTTHSIIQSQAGGMRNGDIAQHQHQQHQHQHHQQHQHQQHQQHQQQQQQQQHQQQQQQLQLQQQQMQPEIIPSLLDMVINIAPTTNETSTTSTTTTGTVATGGQSNNKSEKQRKSRWCDSPATNQVAAKQNNLEPPSSSAPSYLDLKNLTGILSTDRIEKLSQFGVVNLEQINQLTLSQLNNIGLTVTEINEIQLNARNMARLGVVGVHGEPVNTNLSSNAAATPGASGSLPSSQDVDMRFLPSCLPLTTTTITTSTATSEKSMNELQLSSPDPKSIPTGISVASNLQESHSSNVSGIDYSQYLRDSNLGYDKNDLLDDEKDEEQLVIDDQDLDALDDNSQLNDTETKNESENDSKGSPSFSYGGGDSNDSRLPPPIQLSDKLQNLLKDPTNLYTVNVSALLKNNDALSGKIIADSIHAPYDDDDGFYRASASGNNQRDIDAREEYRDSRSKEEYRDPRLPDIKDEYRELRLPPNLSGYVRPPYPYRPPNSDDDSDRSQSPMLSLAEQMENFVPLYERQSMYDWTPKCIQEDIEYNKKHKKADKDMRLSRFVDSSNSDIDLRLPFQPVKNMQIAKEIDASMSTLRPIPYKIKEIDVAEPKYSDLRHSFQVDDSTDPRLRRILGLPELSNSKVLAALGRPSRPQIASPSSVESSSSPTREKERPSASVVRGPRVDPRRAAATATVTSAAGAAQNPAPVPAGNPHQNVEIRMLLQRSDWYKNLNSKYKIMVNQQLALVSTELKRFHQDPSPNKVFDIQFIVSNQSLQQILTNLGIYIDDNGQVAHLENENNDMMGGMGPGMDFGPGGGGNQMMMMNDPNMNLQQRMAMQQQMEFLRGPPPNMNMMGICGKVPMGPGGPGSQPVMFGGPGGMMPPFSRNSRLGILGMPPGAGGNSGFNPFVGNPGDGGGMMDPNYCGPNNPFANNFGANGGNFGGQQMNRGNRNNFNRQGGGPGGGMNNGGGNRMNQNRRGFKNNSRDRRGGGNCGSSGGGINNAGGGGPSGAGNGQGNGGGGSSTSGAAGNVGNQNSTSGDVEENWDDA